MIDRQFNVVKLWDLKCAYVDLIGARYSMDR